MRDNPNRKIEPLYPDVLGAITDSIRIGMEKMQIALGIFPRRTFINQPAEVILIMQNMVDQNMQVKVGVQLPTTDKKGNPVVIDTPKKMIAIGMRPGEVGVLRIPIIPLPPHPARCAVSGASGGALPHCRRRPCRAPPDGWCAAVCANHFTCQTSGAA